MHPIEKWGGHTVQETGPGIAPIVGRCGAGPFQKGQWSEGGLKEFTGSARSGGLNGQGQFGQMQREVRRREGRATFDDGRGQFSDADAFVLLAQLAAHPASHEGFRAQP